MCTARMSPEEEWHRLAAPCAVIEDIMQRLSETDRLRLTEAVEAIFDEMQRRRIEAIQQTMQRGFAKINAMIERGFSCTPGKSASV